MEYLINESINNLSFEEWCDYLIGIGIICEEAKSHRYYILKLKDDRDGNVIFMFYVPDSEKYFVFYDSEENKLNVKNPYILYHRHSGEPVEGLELTNNKKGFLFSKNNADILKEELEKVLKEIK